MSDGRIKTNEWIESREKIEVYVNYDRPARICKVIAYKEDDQKDGAVFAPVGIEGCIGYGHFPRHSYAYTREEAEIQFRDLYRYVLAEDKKKLRDLQGQCDRLRISIDKIQNECMDALCKYDATPVPLAKKIAVRGGKR